MSPRDSDDVVLPPHDLGSSARHSWFGRFKADPKEEATDQQKKLDAEDFLFRSGLVADADRTLFEEFDVLCDGPGRPVGYGTPGYKQKLNEWLVV